MVSYDRLGINCFPLMKLTLRYLYDEFHMLTRRLQERDERTSSRMHINEFDIEEWYLSNEYTATSKQQLTNADCSVFLLKFAQVLQHSDNTMTIKQRHITAYREELSNMIENFV